MPTENRSSNTEMVSVPFQRDDRYIVIKRSDLANVPANYRSALVDPIYPLLAHLPSRECLVIESDWPEYEPAWAAIERRVTGAPAPQPHPEPIAWMVGTAIWWTKEEAERDAAAMSLPVIGLGPMSVVAPTEQRKGEPVMRLECEKLWGGDGEYAVDFVKPGWLQECRKKGGTFLLYTHADPGEAQRQRSRADTNALNHKHAKNALGDIKAFVGRLVAGSNGQASIATGYLADIADFIDRRTIGDPVHMGDANALRLDLQEARRNEFNASAEVERLREELMLLKRTAVKEEVFDIVCKERDTFRSQLEEALDLLSDIKDAPGGSRYRKHIETLLSANAEPSAPTWFCQACQLEQPTDRPCDACGGQTALISGKS